MAESMHFIYAVYLLPGHAGSPSKALRDALAGKYDSLKLVKKLAEKPGEMLVRTDLISDVRKTYAPPDLDRLKYYGNGISREQAAALQKSQQAFILEFAHPREKVWTALRAANELVEIVARNTGGLIYDEETRELYSADAWHKQRLSPWTETVPDISTQMRSEAFDSGEYVKAVTMGMIKVGLPDVMVQDFPWSANEQVSDLINLFCQAMAEGATSTRPGRFRLDVHAIRNARMREEELKSFKPNATGIGCLSFKDGKREEGDPDNRMLELTFDQYSGNDLHAKQDHLFGSLFGWEDNLFNVEHDPELQEASRQARTRLPELRKAFNGGLQPGEFIDLKAPFSAPEGGTEWMWVEVSRWKDDEIQGLLDNDPAHIPNLHAGQIVHVREQDVFDYLHRYPDKHEEGNTTGAILEKMEREGLANKETHTQSSQAPVTECN